VILLDTAVLLWTVRSDARLGARAKSRIESDPAVHVSSASIMELTIKSMMNKIEIPLDLSALLVQEGLLELPISHAHADGMRQFPELAKHDPFDRILVAQAASTGMDLLTSDRLLLRLGRDFIVDARD
jgi:PIN domain nuclease of toxin-antitoxin system